MTTIEKFGAGEFCWVELATTDVAGAKSFYTKLFGWKPQDSPLPDGGVYTIFHSGDRPAAAANEQQEHERSQGIPPHWNLYVSVDDVDKSAAKAAEAGATVLVPPFDVMDAGRMTVLADPTGPVISLWQTTSMPGFAVRDEHGSFSWAECYSPDPQRAATFYEDLFGWTANTVEMDMGPYTILHREGHDIAGLLAPPAPDIPPNWLPYFQVSDAEGITTAAGDAGAHVQMGPMAIPDVGTFSVITDPQGATFAIIRSENPAG